MEGDELLASAKNLMIRLVREKLPMPKRWRVSKEFKSWIEGLPEDEFKIYLDRVRSLSRTSSDEEMPKEKGAFIMFGSYPADQIKARRHLEAIEGESLAYSALALWRNIQAENLRRELE
jgi:hypothetical protein